MLKSLKMADQVDHLVGSVKRITVYTVSLPKSSSGCFCFNDLVSLIILCRLITLWCLKASFSTEKVTFSPLLSHCLVFVKGYVSVYLLCGNMGFKVWPSRHSQTRHSYRLNRCLLSSLGIPISKDLLSFVLEKRQYSHRTTT